MLLIINPMLNVRYLVDSSFLDRIQGNIVHLRFIRNIYMRTHGTSLDHSGDGDSIRRAVRRGLQAPMPHQGRSVSFLRRRGDSGRVRFPERVLPSDSLHGRGILRDTEGNRQEESSGTPGRSERRTYLEEHRRCRVAPGTSGAS